MKKGSSIPQTNQKISSNNLPVLPSPTPKLSPQNTGKQWKDYFSDLLGRTWDYVSNPYNWNKKLGIGILIAGAVGSAYYVWKKIWNRDCSKLEGPDKIGCEVKAINRSIKSLVKNKRKCSRNENPSKCRSEFDILLSKWEKRKKSILSIGELT